MNLACLVLFLSLFRCSFWLEKSSYRLPHCLKVPCTYIFFSSLFHFQLYDGYSKWNIQTKTQDMFLMAALLHQMESECLLHHLYAFPLNVTWHIWYLWKLEFKIKAPEFGCSTWVCNGWSTCGSVRFKRLSWNCVYLTFLLTICSRQILLLSRQLLVSAHAVWKQLEVAKLAWLAQSVTVSITLLLLFCVIMVMQLQTGAVVTVKLSLVVRSRVCELSLCFNGVYVCLQFVFWVWFPGQNTVTQACFWHSNTSLFECTNKEKF